MDIAVIGMSCRFPGANSVEEFWSNLINGKNSVCLTPKNRWFMGANMTAGFLASPIDEFDYNFFNMNPKEASYLDPQQRLFLEVSWECLEDAGIIPKVLSGTKTGVYLGIGENEYIRYHVEIEDDDTMYAVLGNAFSSATGRLAYFLDLKGPCIPIEATCASSAMAIHQACKSLENGESTMVLAGGVSVLTKKNIYPSVVTSTQCKSFDETANGFVPGEGCGIVLLKPLIEAQKDGNRILGVIQTSAAGHTGKSNSFGTPTIEAEEMIIREAYKRQGISPGEIEYLEAHVGGTMGDVIEVKAICNAFSKYQRKEPLVVGSLKPNIGHSMAASGVAGLIKILLSFKHEKIPKQILLKKIHPDINLSLIPAIIPLENIIWPKQTDKIRLAALNSFGITGTNVHIVVAEPPKIFQSSSEQNQSPESSQLLALSAKSKNSLHQLVRAYRESLREDDSNLQDICYSANCLRTQHHVRHAIVIRSKAEAIQKLNEIEHENFKPNTPTQIAFLFPGLGCQYLGMAKSLYKFSAFREAFDKCEELYEFYIGVPLRQVIWEEDTKFLHNSYFSQPAIFCIEYCLYKLWSSLGVTPTIILGHSVGEFCALVALGILSFENAMKMVCTRSILIDKHVGPGSMIALSTDAAYANKLIQEFNTMYPNKWVDIACFNSSDQTVVSTNETTSSIFLEFCQNQAPDLRVKILASDKALHSRHLDPMLKEYQRLVEEIPTSSNMNCDYISSVLGSKVENLSVFDSNYWMKHTREAVQFLQASKTLAMYPGEIIFVEIGPHPILASLLRTDSASTFKNSVYCTTLSKGQSDTFAFLKSVAKLYTNCDLTLNFSSVCSGSFVDIPKYRFDRKKCWIVPRTKFATVDSKIAQYVHPLLGYAVELPGFSGNEERFNMLISSSSTGYVHDHVIVNNIIIPGACYVEILLALGLKISNTFGVSDAIIIENLEILRALPLEEDTKQIHTRVTHQKESSRVVIYSKNKEQWVEQCLGTVKTAKLNSTPTCINIMELEKRCCNYINMTELYQKMDATGISMGPLFKSLERLSYDSGKNESLSIYKSFPWGLEYFCHPIIIDAMVQSFWQYRFRKLENPPFALPIEIKRFTFFPTSRTDIENNEFKFAFHLEDGEIGTLYTESGTPVATMECLSVFESTKYNFLKSISDNGISARLPQFMEKVWVRTNDFSEKDNKQCSGLSDISIILDHDPAWLIFCNTPSKLYEFLANGLINDGNLPIQVIHGENFSKPKAYTYIVDPTRESDFKQLAHSLMNYKVKGILFLWTNDLPNEISDIKTTMLEKLTLGFLNTLKMNIRNNWNSKVILITLSAQERNILQHPFYGILETYFNEYKEQEGFSVIIDQVDEESEESLYGKRILNLLKSGSMERIIKLSNNAESVLRLHNFDPNLSSDEITISDFNNYHLRNVQTFSFAPYPKDQVDYFVEIEIKAVGLNFRDILLHLSLLETDIPDSLGLEFSGVVRRTKESKFKEGDNVAGFTCSGSFRSHIQITNPNLIFKIPDHVPFGAAATLPVAYGTCYLAMLKVGKVKAGESILIHTASGGVGLAGIQLAKHLGLQIYATAGTKKKRNYLLEVLGLKHVYNSRTTDYKEAIFRDTNRKGVDVIINTLTGPGFKEASIDVLGKHGRFIELSKLNIWSSPEVNHLRPDVEYTILDAFTMIQNSHPFIIEAMQSLSQLFLHRKLETLPYFGFPLLKLKSAFKYFQDHNHIGKVIVEMPSISNGKLMEQPLYYPESTYLITGGGSGIGLYLGMHLLQHSGANVVLVGRRSTLEPEVLKDLMKYDSRVSYVQADVGNYESCRKLVEPFICTLKGIFHCACVYSNAIILGQNQETISKSFHAKVYGAWNLHQVTKQIPLNYFIVFSSISAVIGSTGMSNYSAANRFLDALINYRVNELGLPGLSINWGAWGEVGAAADAAMTGLFKYFPYFSPEAGIQALERSLRLGLHDIVIADLDNEITEMYPRLQPLFSEISITKSEGVAVKMSKFNSNAIKDSFDKSFDVLGKAVLESESELRASKIENLVEAIFRNYAGLSNSDNINRTQPLTDMGMDSLIGIEMRLHISNQLNIQIPTNAVQEHNSVKLFSQYLNSILIAQCSSKDHLAPESKSNSIQTKLGKENKTNGKSKIKKYMQGKLQKLM